MGLQIVKVVFVFICKLRYNVSRIHQLQINLYIFSYQQFSLRTDTNVFHTKYFAKFIVWTRLAFFIMKIDLPMLPFTSIVIFYIIAISCLKTTHSFESHCVSREIRPKWFNNLHLCNQIVKSTMKSVIFHQRKVIRILTMNFIL